MRSAPAAIRGSSSSARAARIRPRWSSSSSSSSLPAFRLDIAYDGSRFRGWARQNGERTVQAEIESALEQILGEPVRLTVAGRTDSGVHASGQVASFTTDRDPPPTLLRALNSLTPPDLSIFAVEPAAEGFDARRDARSRRYRYRIETSSIPSPFERGRALWFPRRLDVTALERCAEAVIGRHDFTAFTPSETEHVHFHREVFDAVWSRESETVLAFEIEADAFMRSMVRILVGTMLEVGGGRRSHESFAALLTGAARPAAGETAPPHGLCLIAVRY